MSALEPGLYRATVRGVADVTVLIADSGFGHTIKRYATSACSGPDYVHGPEKITDARPLILLDLAYPGDAVNALKMAARDGTNGDARPIYRAIADQIEAQTKPARIPEPKHIGSLVMASTTGRDSIGVWTKFSEVGLFQWITPGGVIRQWSNLIDPEPFPFGGKS